MVLTEEQQTDMYPAATMEAASTTTEEALYANLNTTRIAKPTGYPVDNTTNPNANVAKVTAATGGQKVGPSITLKVMAGDKFNLKVSSWYKTNGASPGTPVSPLPDLLAALINGVSGASGGKVATTQLQTSGVLTPGATNFLNSQAPAAGRPKAYLNWILFDEQFNFVSSNSGFEQVPAESAFGTVPNQIVYPHVKSNLTIDKCGYLYVYVSNETPNIDVFFDNLQVTHVRGPILEINNYYPFGLLMSGLSYKSAGKLENKKKYNGYELNTDFDLNVYESFYRIHDPQTGRFWQIDPKVEEGQESMSPYSAMANDPVLNSDPLGDIAENSQVESESSESSTNCCPGAAGILQSATQTSTQLGPIGKAVVVGGAIVAALYAVGEFFAENPEALSGGGKSQSYPATFDLYIKSGESKPAPPKPVVPTVVQTQKKGPKDLVGDAKAAQQKEADAKARAANRQAQTTQGNNKQGQSNQGTRGSHNSGGNKPGKHDKAEARRAKEQKAADAKKEAAKKKDD